jgi:hypothetical protein
MRSCTLIVCVLMLCSAGCIPRNDVSSSAQNLFERPEEPLVFLSVYPEPTAIVSLSSPDNWGYLLGTANGDIQWPETVCAGVGVGALLRPGDDLDSFNNIRLSLDGNVVEDDPRHNVVLVAIAGKDGGQGPLSDFMCWYMEGWVRPGIRMLSLLLWTSTEEEFSYDWAIKVTG